MTTGTIAVITIAAGRHEHLRRQRLGLSRGSLLPHLHVVVALGDPELEAVLQDGPDAPPFVVDPQPRTEHLALAAARNRGAQLAIASGADVLIFLDVDCVPGARMVERYAHVVAAAPGPELFSGPVAYLPPPPPEGYRLANLHLQAGGHPARPVPAEDEVVSGGDHLLFWSLSFALSNTTWQELGGFCETYDGYGAEDTDFAQIAAARGIGHSWVGGAWAYHQYHPTTDPPVQHLRDIIRNATTFHTRWGWWPMQGWLSAFEARGLARFDARAVTWQALASDPPEVAILHSSPEHQLIETSYQRNEHEESISVHRTGRDEDRRRRHRLMEPFEVRCTTTAPPEAVFEVLADGWLFASWVVGAARVRDVDAGWPETGSRIHHSFGFWPIMLNDVSEVLIDEPPRYLVIKPKGWPLGEARVEVRVDPWEHGSMITITEDAVAGPGRLIPQPLRQVLIAARNKEALRRLALLAEGGAGDASDVS